MKRVTVNIRVLAIAIVSALPAFPLLAQDAPRQSGPASVTLDAVKVSARKREETLQDVPVAVTAFTPEALDRFNISDLGDLGAQVPGLTIYAARGSSNTITAYIRGIGQSDPLWGVDPGVGVYIDDVYLARPQGALLDVLDVERVEVLRGPQGSLYGKNTIGGAIRYITRGLPKDTSGFASITLGNYHQLDIKAAIGGSLIGNGTLRARLSIASMNRDGFGKNIITGQDVSDKQINAARLQLGAFINENLDIQFALDYMDDQSGARGAQMLAPNPMVPDIPPIKDRYNVRSGMLNINDTEMKGASVGVNWRANDDWSFKYILARRESDKQTNVDYDTTPLPLVDSRVFYHDRQTSQELQANFDAGGRARGVMGLYWFDGDAGGQILNYFWNPTLPTTPTNPLFGGTGGKVNTRSIAVYADWTFALADHLDLNLGARYTDEDKHAIVLNQYFTDTRYTSAWENTADFDRRVNFKNISPKVSLDWHITPNIMAYGLFSRGFKSGGYNIRANTTSIPRSGEPFDDEQVDSFEIGSKLSLLDQRLFLNLAYFYNKYKDIQLSVFTSFTLPDGTETFFGDFTNAGKGTVQGLEVEYQILPSPHWIISGNLAWLDARYDEFIDRGVNIASRQRFTNAPELSGTFNLEYRTGLGNGGTISARASYAWQSEVWPTTDLSPLIRQGGYGIVNAGVRWQIDHAWSLSLQRSNLSDKEYRTTGYNLGAYGVLSGFYGPPRQYSLTARYDF